MGSDYSVRDIDGSQQVFFLILQDEATLACWLWEMALQLGAAGGQSTAAAPWILCRRLWRTAVVPQPLHRLMLQVQQINPYLFVG